MINYSVLMTVYKNDSPEYFRLSVKSMLDQTVKTNDFVLVCDGDLTEGLEKAIRDSFKGYESILNTVRLPKNVGLGKALNIGLRLCKNEWVARMDDDDISHLDRCETELKVIKKYPGLSLVGSYVNEFDSDPNKPIRVKKVPTKYSEIKKFSKRRNPFCHSTMMLKKEDIIKAGNYSTMRTNQDVDTWIRVLNYGFRGVNIARPLVDFRFDSNTYKRRKEWKNSRLMIEVWRNFWKKGYCSIVDYIIVSCAQITIFFMPEKLLQYIYSRLNRTKV